MTVCIGALCEDGRSIVLASDRMMTYGPPVSLQTEPRAKKILPISGHCCLLFSGGVAEGEEVASVVRRHALGAPNMLISEIAEQAKQAYIALKKKRVEDTVLRPFLGLDFQGFQALVAQSSSSQILG